MFLKYASEAWVNIKCSDFRVNPNMNKDELEFVWQTVRPLLLLLLSAHLQGGLIHKLRNDTAVVCCSNGRNWQTAALQSLFIYYNRD